MRERTGEERRREIIIHVEIPREKGGRGEERRGVNGNFSRDREREERLSFTWKFLERGGEEERRGEERREKWKFLEEG